MTSPRGTRSAPGHPPPAASAGQAARSGVPGLTHLHDAQPSDQAPARRRHSRHRGTLVLWGFLVPALLVFAYFKFYPIGYGVWLSFHDVGIMGNNRWIGLENFSRAIEDTLLHEAFWHTVVYVA